MNRFDLPNLGVGIGLRTRHYAEILEREPGVDWFEILSDNYMHTAGRPLLVLDRIAARYPLAMHGVSLSIGSTDPIDWAYVAELAKLRERTGARWISDHLAWTGVAGRNAHELLPMPYTAEALRHTARRVREVQDFLGAPLALENPSSYLELTGEMTEARFLAELAREADCALLLDVNNVYVSAHNHGFDPWAYLDAIPFDRVVQIHVAGHTRLSTHLLDTHVGPVLDEVWDLAAEAHARSGASLLLEWDAEIPVLDVVHREAQRIHEALERRRARARGEVAA